MSRVAGLRRSAVLSGLAGAMLATAFLPMASAAASPDLILIDVGDGHGWVHDSATPLLDFQRMAPGVTVFSVLGIQNASDSTSALTVRSLDIADDDNGCNGPESLVDSTCGPGEGELGHQLIFRIYLDKSHSGTFAGAPVWTGSIYDLTAAPALDPSMPAHAKWDVKFEVELPFSSGNETQTDQLGFGLRIALASESGEGGSTDVPGTTVGRDDNGPRTTPSTEVEGIKEGPRGPHVLGHLPFTGASLAGGVELAIGLLLLGAAVLIPARKEKAKESR